MIVFRSTVLGDTLSPKWPDEEWIVRNVPRQAKLTVAVYDKDDGSLSDDFIGEFEIPDLPNYQAPADGHRLIGKFGGKNGRFYLTIQSVESPIESKQLPRYTFDGPCRFTRHFSAAMGRLTMLNTESIYSTWKIHIKRISVYFPFYERQYWNRHYRIAQTIFGSSIRSLVKQNSFKLAHRVLYDRTIKNNQFGRLHNADDLWKLIFFDEQTQRIRARFYTYIIDDTTWRFSETGEGYFTDYASKHALHANCSEYVRYGGQFHPRPRYGWDRPDEEWELVFDNWSGTYAPHLNLLPKLKELLEFNFPSLNVVVYDYKDPLLHESMEQLKIAESNLKKDSSALKTLMFNPSLKDM